MKSVAVVTFVDDNPFLIEEFSWLYKSWIYSGSYRCSDLVVFCHPAAKDKLVQDKNLMYVPMMPLSRTDASWTTYPFVNSVHFLTTEVASFIEKYEYVLRTDNDTFLTHNFVGLRPRLALFGMGAYVREEVADRKLPELAKKFKLNYCYIRNVGSTIFYKSSRVILYSKHQLALCKLIRDTEFKEDNAGTWPGWFSGTLTMYAGELAANDIFDYGIYLGGLDCMSMSSDEIGSNDYHIHAYHTNQYFSKLKWREGSYKDIDRNKLNVDRMNDYCMFIAMMPVKEIAEVAGYKIKN